MSLLLPKPSISSHQIQQNNTPKSERTYRNHCFHKSPSHTATMTGRQVIPSLVSYFGWCNSDYNAVQNLFFVIPDRGESKRRRESLDDLDIRLCFSITMIRSNFRSKAPKKLNLSLTKLTHLPNEIGNLKNLTKLNLAASLITSLPASIGELQALQELNLSFTKLTHLPNEIGNLKNLTELELAASMITSLPASIGELQALQELNLRSPKLTHLPNEIGNLKNLTKLNLACSRITSLPASIGELQALQELDLEYAKLAHVPNEIGIFKNLTKLKLAGSMPKLPYSIKYALACGSFRSRAAMAPVSTNCKGKLLFLLDNTTTLFRPISFREGNRRKRVKGIDEADRVYCILVHFSGLLVETLINRDERLKVETLKIKWFTKFLSRFRKTRSSLTCRTFKVLKGKKKSSV